MQPTGSSPTPVVLQYHCDSCYLRSADMVAVPAASRSNLLGNLAAALRRAFLLAPTVTMAALPTAIHSCTANNRSNGPLNATSSRFFSAAQTAMIASSLDVVGSTVSCQDFAQRMRVCRIDHPGPNPGQLSAVASETYARCRNILRRDCTRKKRP